MEQLSLLDWSPPKKPAKAWKPRRGEDPRPCGCGLNKGRGYIWRDNAGADHIECEACNSGPRYPFFRETPAGPYPGSIGAANAMEGEP